MQMNILVTLDRNYLLPLRVLLHSILTSDPRSTFTLYAAHASLTEEDFALLRTDVGLMRCTIVPIEVPAHLLEDAPTLRRLSKASYYRLIAPSYLPPEVDRILYLDPDITVIRSLRDFYFMDLQGKYIAAAGHLDGVFRRFNCRRLRIRHNDEYFNSGVLLMDVQALRALDNNEQIFDFVRANKRRLLLGDQDTVNMFYDGHILTVDAARYNLDERTYRRLQRRGEIDLRWVRDNAVIIHYNGKEKPWHPNYSGELGSYFFRARKGLERTIGVSV